ncbi:Glycoside hydrolase family 20 catalytic domain [Trinorchestia longiramus]|nr:Glycoside hydrolase family 20 catalytic domain [Trinorchestia longiramus]
MEQRIKEQRKAARERQKRSRQRLREDERQVTRDRNRLRMQQRRMNTSQEERELHLQIMRNIDQESRNDMNDVSRFIPINVDYVYTGIHSSVSDLITEAWEHFLFNLETMHPDHGATTWGEWTTNKTFNSYKLNVEFFVETEISSLSSATNESYTLSILSYDDRSTVKIEAETFYGARHGLETLSQLMNYDTENNCLQMINFLKEIYDNPVFPHRGLSVDTSRNFITIDAIKRTLDIMAANKLNRFHWHITDTHSFPMKMQSRPELHQYGAYSPRQVYTKEDIKDIVHYGNTRGVLVYPEFDSPAHVGNGWQWGPSGGLGNLAVCVNQEPWQSYCVEPPCGQLNLANPFMYEVLTDVYTEMNENFGPLSLFHFGGDEVNMNCWNSSDEIREWMAGNLSEAAYLEKWSEFHVKSWEIFQNISQEPDMKGILWTSTLTETGRAENYIDKDKFIIQLWTEHNDTVAEELASKGYDLIFSNYDTWYLDCGMEAWVGEGYNWCSPYNGWKKVYTNSPFDLLPLQYHGQIVGGEAALWTEQADSETIDSKLWPRGAALAERLWANPSTSWEVAEPRLLLHRQRLVERGAAAERLQPQWCLENEGFCYL